MAEPLTLPEARHFCPRCSKVFHRAFACGSCGCFSAALPEGLHFASDEDVAVLEAWGQVDGDWLEQHVFNETLAEPIAAELARREAKR